MNLIFDDSTNLEYLSEESINESSGKSEKKYKIKGIFSTIGEKNKNGRIYPRKLWVENVNKYQDEIKNGTSNSLMELNHPPRTTVDMMEAVAKIEKLYIKDNYVMGEAVLLNNEKANQLKSLIDAGIKMAVSSRGTGKLGKGGLVENFNLITYDIIPDQNQSDYNAEMYGLRESFINEGFSIKSGLLYKDNKVCDEFGCRIITEDTEETVETVPCICEQLKIYKPSVVKNELKKAVKETILGKTSIEELKLK